jgi:ATP-dependent DNA helicase RecG
MTADGPVLLHGTVTISSSRYVRRRLHIVDGVFSDSSGSVAVRWFNQPWIADRLEGGVDAFLFGAVATGKSGRPQLTNPEVEIGDETAETEAVKPIYPKLGPLAGKRLRTVMLQALGCLDSVVDPLPESLLREMGLPSLTEVFDALHDPRPPESATARTRLVEDLNGWRSAWHGRLAFDELLAVSVVVAETRARRAARTARPIDPGAGFQRRAAALFDFQLTRAQRDAAAAIIDDLADSVPMARLLQGDVGSGKTAVATIAIYAAVRGGRQAALMAPTELLAEQLHRSLSSTLGKTGCVIELLTGALPASHAKDIRGRLAAGSIDVVVGTHALFQESVDYADLGLVVIDEQHRFGVVQRQRLLDKGVQPHLLVMTATPIPRSLALTLYGDLELTIIDELPPGRRPVRTEVRDPSARPRILEFLKSEVGKGGQGFIVCPVIDPSSKIEAVSVTEHVELVEGAMGGMEIGVLHGRLERGDRDEIARRFRGGELKVILATTVIEVGVDVPAASVMIIENADRFGLSQLHQLRGRVGRGVRRSWCILITGDQPSDHGLRRLRVLERTTDGFEIAEADLRHRGPGELTGRRQWGVEGFRFADLGDVEMVVRARSVARRLARDGALESVRSGLLQYHAVGEDVSIG